ncbi:MAG: hypothetical protein EPO37_05455 [Nitrosarchaeum sp.]|nr:MAG: hypothetical protein EPO37_05455 [Nitrosarchaeum sp.]
MLSDVFIQISPLDITKELIDYWWSFPIGFLLFVLGYFFTHPDKIAIWSSIISGLFEKLSKRSARHSVSSDIQSRISSYIKNNKSDEILPYGLKFKWVKDENFSSYVEEKDVIIIMDYHNNNAKNFVNAIGQYISQAFIPTVRHEIPQDVLIAAELVMQEKIIQEKRPDALDTFRNEVLPTKIANNVNIEQFRERFKKLDIIGFFDNMFLTEIVFAGSRLQDLIENQRKQEIENFITFIENIPDESKPLDFSGNVFHVWITLVAKQFKKDYQGTAPYVKRAEEAYSKKYDSLYVTGRDQNMDFVNDVISDIKTHGIGYLEWVRDFKTRDKKRKKKIAKMALFRL